MASIRFTDVQVRPSAFLDLTGLTLRDGTLYVKGMLAFFPFVSMVCAILIYRYTNILREFFVQEPPICRTGHHAPYASLGLTSTGRLCTMRCESFRWNGGGMGRLQTSFYPLLPRMIDISTEQHCDDDPRCICPTDAGNLSICHRPAYW